jgi:sec-independent protein translocase protein TatA
MNLGAPEILVILVLALLVFGPHKLPEIGRQVGGAMRELRKMQDSVKHEIQSVMADDKPTQGPPASAVGPTGAPAEEGPPAPASAVEEPDHTDVPPPRAAGFDGPSGSFS